MDSSKRFPRWKIKARVGRTREPLRNARYAAAFFLFDMTDIVIFIMIGW
jgi:hypothetical protein